MATHPTPTGLTFTPLWEAIDVDSHTHGRYSPPHAVLRVPPRLHFTTTTKFYGTRHQHTTKVWKGQAAEPQTTPSPHTLLSKPLPSPFPIPHKQRTPSTQSTTTSYTRVTQRLYLTIVYRRRPPPRHTALQQQPHHTYEISTSASHG